MPKESPKIYLLHSTNDMEAKSLVTTLISQGIRVVASEIGVIPVLYIDDACYTGMTSIIEGLKKEFPSLKLPMHLGDLNATKVGFKEF